MNQYQKSLYLLLLLSLVATSSASAALIVNPLSTDFSPGQSGVVDVIIESDANSPSPLDRLSGWSADFVLRLSGNPSTSFQWNGTQDGSSALADPNYVFSPGTTGPLGTVTNLSTFAGTSPVTISMGQTVLTWSENAIAEATLPFPIPADANIPFAGSSRLLARLEIQHILPMGVDPATTIGDQFTVDIENAQFRLADGTNLVEGTDFSVGSSFVTVASVPEPRSFLLLMAFAMLRVRRRSDRSEKGVLFALSSRI